MSGEVMNPTRTVPRAIALTLTLIAFGRSETNRPQPIATPPFFALKYFPLSRKSLGGVAVDLSCRILDRRGQPIPNLYAVGELAGVGGINGRAALEGTMLGPGLLMGRIAARDVVAHLKSDGKLPPNNSARSPPAKSFVTKTSDPESLRAWRARNEGSEPETKPRRTAVPTGVDQAGRATRLGLGLAATR